MIIFVWAKYAAGLSPALFPISYQRPNIEQP